VSEAEKKDALPVGPIVMDWYIIKVAFNREDSIRDALNKRIKLGGMEAFFGEILIPTEDVVTFTRNGTRRVVKRKLYPGYLMAYMAINDDTWFLVRETPGVGDFTGSNGKPTPMDPHDVERIIKSVRPDEVEGEKALKTAIPFRSGDRVRCKEGYFQNLEGEVEKVDEANGRVTVIISIFGRSTPVELDHWQIEAV
jgi:transcription termination/antitermination protein NusG